MSSDPEMKPLDDDMEKGYHVRYSGSFQTRIHGEDNPTCPVKMFKVPENEKIQFKLHPIFIAKSESILVESINFQLKMVKKDRDQVPVKYSLWIHDEKEIRKGMFLSDLVSNRNSIIVNNFSLFFGFYRFFSHLY